MNGCCNNSLVIQLPGTVTDARWSFVAQWVRPLIRPQCLLAWVQMHVRKGVFQLD